MKVIFNADDFGYSRGVNAGIIDAYKHGVVRSTTLMTGMAGFFDAVVLAKENPDLGVGVHLTLTAGFSVGGAYKTITDENGKFFQLGKLEDLAKNCKIDLGEVRAEYEAQVNKAIDAGLHIDHLDSHHHTHNLPGIVDIFLDLAKKLDLGVRLYDKSLLTGKYASIRTTADFSEDFYADGVSLDGAKKIIGSAGGDSLEIMCHPAFVDLPLYVGSSYNIGRVEELDVLTSEGLKGYLSEKNIALSSFKGI